MPTARPTIEHSDCVATLTSVIDPTRRVIANPKPTVVPATTSGSSAAPSVRNAAQSTTRATTRPMISPVWVAVGSGRSIGWPPNPTCSPARSAIRPVRTRSSSDVLGISKAPWRYTTGAQAVVPSLEVKSAAAGPVGSSTDRTPGSAAIARTVSCTACLAVGSLRAPFGLENTAVTRPPAWSGNSRSRVSRSCCEGADGTRMASLGDRPHAIDPMPTRAAVISQPATTPSERARRRVEPAS